MAFTLKEILDISKLSDLLGSLEEIQKIPSAILDKEGNILVATAWQDICTKFHRVNPEVEKQCKISDRYIESKLEDHLPLVVYRCPMGLTDAAMPIVVDGEHLGNVYVGQLFTEPPAEEHFISQARKYGFDENLYLSAMRKVPHIPEEKLRKDLFFIHSLTQILAEQGWQFRQQKIIESNLREAEWKFKALFDNGPIGVAYHAMIYDETGRAIDYYFLDANEKYQELTGVDPRGKTVTEAFPGIENDPFDWIGTFGHVAREGKTIRFEQYLQANDRWYDCVAYQFKPDHFVAAFQEITERKKLMEEQARSSQLAALGTIAAGVAHEINNPVNGVINYAALIRSRAGNSDAVKDLAKLIEKEGIRIAKLTRDLLHYSKDSRKEKQLIKIRDVIDGALTLTSTKIKKENISIEIDIPDRLPVIIANSQSLIQVIINFLENSYYALKVKENMEEEKVIRIMCSTDIEDGREHVCIDVYDNGIGMNKETIDKAKDAFFTTKPSVDGSGLGLSIVNEIINMHHGHFIIESTKGEYTKMRICLPVDAPLS